MLDKEIKQIYPQLPLLQEDPLQRDDGVNYRLKTISNIQQQLNRERDDRNNLYKKYKRAINVVDAVDTVFNSISVTCSRNRSRKYSSRGCSNWFTASLYIRNLWAIELCWKIYFKKIR